MITTPHWPIPLGHKPIDLGLERIREVLNRLGNPEKKLPPVIHVVGTNGKGSSIAFMRAIAEAAGYKAHVYTSPHLVHFNERIVLAGEVIADGFLYEMLETCRIASEDIPLTFFEGTTAAALLAFSRVDADIVLLETGLGGRLDATNVIDRPALTLITPISFDHTEFLGTTLTAIAAEKAGILKPGVPCVASRQEAQAERVIIEKAASLASPLWLQGRDWHVQKGGTKAPSPSGRGRGEGVVFRCGSGIKEPILGGKQYTGNTPSEQIMPSPHPLPEGEGFHHTSFTYTSPHHTLTLPAPSLLGAHQYMNAGAAITAMLALPGFSITTDHIIHGLTHAQHRARLQRLDSGTLTSLLPKGWELWLDGGHNPAGGEALAAMAKHWQDKPLYLISGMLKDKDCKGFFTPLASYVQKVVCITIPGEEKSFSPEALAACVAEVGIETACCNDVAEAIQHITNTASPSRILIAGSLYLAGHVLGL